jgi:hypothetical protein
MGKERLRAKIDDVYKIRASHLSQPMHRIHKNIRNKDKKIKWK